MSIEPEDTLEEALRGDFPTPATEARVRRRLLAAGVAVGQGVATTTAAAAGGGVVAKLAGLSWGVKLGLAAAVAIPSVGLLLDGRAERPRAPDAPMAAPARPAALNEQLVVPSPNTPEVAAAEPVTPTSERQPQRASKAPAPNALPASDAAATPAHPSQADFAPAAPPARAPQVGSTLAEETRLLDAAFAELATGNPARAAALIQDHEARFPTGLLQRERERAKSRLSEMSRAE